MKSITVGRDLSCDIILNNPRISRMHASISVVNGGYVYKDMSTNGSVVNGKTVKSKNVNIRPGDTILLAATDALPWSKVQMLLPLNAGNITPRPEYQTPTPTPVANNYQSGAANSFTSPSSTPSILNSWSWGGFFFGWLWAVFNGIYWPLVSLIPVIGTIAGLVIAIVLGINGNRMAWEKKTWQSVAHFEKTQKQWAIAALIVFSLSIVSVILIFVFAAAAIGSAF